MIQEGIREHCYEQYLLIVNAFSKITAAYNIEAAAVNRPPSVCYPRRTAKNTPTDIRMRPIDLCKVMACVGAPNRPN
jgi:hypothetical protein